MSEVDGGDPSSAMPVCPEQIRIRSAPLTSTACEKPKALDQSQGFTSVRSIEVLLASHHVGGSDPKGTRRSTSRQADLGNGCNGMCRAIAEPAGPLSIWARRFR